MQICYTFFRQSAHLQTELVKSDDKKMLYLLYFYTAHSCCGSENIHLYYVQYPIAQLSWGVKVSQLRNISGQMFSQTTSTLQSIMRVILCSHKHTHVKNTHTVP